MHMGVTRGPDCARPFARLADGTAEGAVSADGRVCGTYIHGLFADDRQRSAWLARLGGGASALAYETQVEATLDRLAAHLAAHVDVDRLLTPGAMSGFDGLGTAVWQNPSRGWSPDTACPEGCLQSDPVGPAEADNDAPRLQRPRSNPSANRTTMGAGNRGVAGRLVQKILHRPGTFGTPIASLRVLARDGALSQWPFLAQSLEEGATDDDPGRVRSEGIGNQSQGDVPQCR
jgi:hypothetical protein